MLTVSEMHPYEIGMVGLGVMGRNLVLNMAEHGFSVAGYDRDPGQVRALRDEADRHDIKAVESLPEFVSLLCTPRTVMLLVPAGVSVDSVIHDLLSYLEPDDLIIDGGNSHFTDTDLRAKALAEKGILFMGVGISGGEHGARNGPSLMPGGPKTAYERVRRIFESIAAKVDDEPCVTYLGTGSAGHYVKMVHNGIEYALIQLIAETYDLMKRGLGLTDDELSDVYHRWNHAEFDAYLIEITARIFQTVDEKTGLRLTDVILDEAKQKGTGKWTSQDAMDLQAPVPTIDMAVAMRDMSAFKSEREAASRVLNRAVRPFQGNRESWLIHLRDALYAAMLVAYAQGMAQLGIASQAYQYNLNLEDVASIWRDGCIIRAALLKDIRAAFHTRPDLPNLLA